MNVSSFHWFKTPDIYITALALAGEGERDGAGEGLVHGGRGLVVEVGGLVGGAGVASVAAGVRAEGGRLDNVDTDRYIVDINIMVTCIGY